MATITRQGTLELRTQNEGSKSEGRYAILLTDGGTEFTLYRAGNMPMDDAYFAPYDGFAVEVVGVEEDAYFRVEEIKRCDNELNEE